MYSMSVLFSLAFSSMTPPARAEENDPSVPIRQFSEVLVDRRSRAIATWNAALQNFETTVRTTSPPDTTASALAGGVGLGLKVLTSTALKEVPGAAAITGGYDVLVKMQASAVAAAEASESRDVSGWIIAIRTGAANEAAQAPSAADLTDTLVAEYSSVDPGPTWTLDELAKSTATLRAAKAPTVQESELAMYEGYLNALFTNDCMGDVGLVAVAFNDDGTVASATVKGGSLGPKIASGINNTMGAAGRSGVLALKVIKRACLGDTCICYDEVGQMRMDTDDASARAILTNPANWSRMVLR